MECGPVADHVSRIVGPVIRVPIDTVGGAAAGSVENNVAAFFTIAYEARSAGAGTTKLTPERLSSTATVRAFVTRLQRSETSMPSAER